MGAAERLPGGRFGPWSLTKRHARLQTQRMIVPFDGLFILFICTTCFSIRHARTRQRLVLRPASTFGKSASRIWQRRPPSGILTARRLTSKGA